MAIELIQISSKEERNNWNQFISQSPDGGLLQSIQWGDFHKSLGNQVFYLANKEKTCMALGIKLQAGNQYIFYCPRGPIIKQDLKNTAEAKSIYKQMIYDLRDFAKTQQCFLFRFDSPYLLSDFPVNEYCSQQKKQRQPLHTLRLDLSKTQDELFSSFKSKHRYNIRLAEKKDITTSIISSEYLSQEVISSFSDLIKKTSDRQKFQAYDNQYYQKLIESDQSNSIYICFAQKDQKMIAAILLMIIEDNAYYVHGASDYEYRSQMAPHLLQWEAIQYAKETGCSVYDFWGVANNPPVNTYEKDLLGVTRFKKGFAPKQHFASYPGTFELPALHFPYFLYRVRNLIK